MNDIVFFNNLRAANKARQAEWDKFDGITNSYRGNEMAGEVGEALEKAVQLILMSAAAGRASNIIKKLEREALGIPGSRATKEELSDELSDMVICADLVAMGYDIPLMDVGVPNKFNSTSEKVGLKTRLAPWDEAKRIEQSLRPAVEAIRELNFRTNPMGAGADPLYKLVGEFSIALLKKLLASKEKYGFKDDWLCDDWKASCLKQFHEHISKGDPLDAAAYLAFMWHHKWPTQPITFLQDKVDSSIPTQPMPVDRSVPRYDAKSHPEPGFVKPDTVDSIYFYEQDFYVFSNFSAFELRWRGRNFATSEQAYQWTKFDTPSIEAREVQRTIANCCSAHDAFKIAEANKSAQAPNWDKIKVRVMYQILHEKVAQHKYVERKLRDSKERVIIEDSWRDDFWGWGKDRSGKNVLGLLWMRVRQDILNGRRANFLDDKFFDTIAK